MACLEGNLRKVFFLSNPDIKFRVPNYCITDPIFERDYEKLKKEYNYLQNKNIEIILYYVAKNKNYKIETTLKSSVKDIKKHFAEIIGINFNQYKIRLFYKGIELKDENLLCYDGVQNLSKIQVMANPN